MPTGRITSMVFIPKKCNQQRIAQTKAGSAPCVRADQTCAPVTGRSEDIKILFMNVRGIKQKIGQLEVLNSELVPDILCFAEHFCISSDEIESCSLENYQLITYYCRKEITRGGVSLYGSKNNIDIKHFNLNIEPVDRICEFTAADFTFNDSRCIVLCVYTTYNFDSMLRKLADVLDYLFQKSCYMVVLGDFNVHFESVNSQSEIMIKFMEGYGLGIHNREVTRVCGTAESSLDSVFSNIPLDQTDCRVVKTTISDHYSLLFTLKSDGVRKGKKFRKQVRTFSRQNTAAFLSCLNLETWDSVYGKASPSAKYDCFAGIFRYHFENCFPLHTVTISDNQKTWVSNEIRLWSLYIRDLYHLFRNTQCQQIRQLYLSEKAAYINYVREYKITLNDNRILNAPNKSKAVWNIINSNKTRVNGGGEGITLIQDQALIDDPERVANVFGSLLLSHAEGGSSGGRWCGDGGTDTLPRQQQRTQNSIYLLPATAGEVLTIIRQLPNKHSSGLDGIPVSLIKSCGACIAEPLTDIINSCFRVGEFPDGLKSAKGVPIHKKGSPSNPDNYRIISVLPSLSKIIERALYERLMSFFKHHHVLSNTQYGFVPGLSTQLAIYSSLVDVMSSLDSGSNVAGLYFDLSKAFDMVDHGILINKLELCGVRGLVSELLKSYLTGRSVYVRVRAQMGGYMCHSDSEKVSLVRGVPQGSVLGPLLFLIYVNDLQCYFNGGGSVYQFADDTSCLVTGRDYSDLANKCSEVVSAMTAWSRENRLQLNTSKTALTVFSLKPRNKSLRVVVDCHTLPEVSSIKFLGLNIDSVVTWESHVHTLVNRLNSALYAIRSLQQKVSLFGLRVYYFAHVQSILSYGIVFWGSAVTFKNLFVIQKRIIRALCRISSRTSCRKYFRQLGFLTLPALYIYHLVMFARLNLKLFPTGASVHNRVTRHGGNLRIPPHSTTAYGKFCVVRCIRAYNALPQDMRHLKNNSIFKRELRKLLIDGAVYSFEEYIG